MNKTDEEFIILDTAKAAKIYKCSVYTLRNLVKSQQLPAAKIGKSYTFLKSDLDAIFQKSQQSTAQAVQTKQRTKQCQSINETTSGILIYKQQAAKELDALLAQPTKSKRKNTTTKSNTSSGDKNELVSDPNTHRTKLH